MEPEIISYPHILGTLKEKINQAKLRAVLNVNAELLGINWEIGRMITLHEADAGWGAKIIDRLAEDLRLEFPDMKGFSTRNLRYMREFYQAYPFLILQPVVAKLEMALPEEPKNKQITDNQYDIILQPLVAKLPWTHHVVILTKVKETKERVFYIKKCIENGWSRIVLETQIDTHLHRRQGSSLNNFSETLPKLQSDLARETFKNPYVFDFLSKTDEMQERDLESALIQHLKKFMLELGKGFAFVGNQYRLQVEGDEFIIDLLFYNYLLHSFVLFELKLCEFQPEFAGKLNFYINAVDAQLKGPADKPTVGILLCKTPNATVVKYALKGVDTPIGISEYQLAEVISKHFGGGIPSIAALEAEMDKEYAELKKPTDQKLDRVKAMMRNLQQEAREMRDPAHTAQIFTHVVLPFRAEILAAMADISALFAETQVAVWAGPQRHEDDADIQAYLATHPPISELRLELKLQGSNTTGKQAIEVAHRLHILLESHRYLIGLEAQDPATWLECHYGQYPGQEKRGPLVEAFTASMLDLLETRLADMLQDSSAAAHPH
jgi:predicted nuclease of restriction endonuclease-like (RecB) superfamily